jgi:hypothetical protein
MNGGAQMNIENIEAFVYINHYGSFNKAADVLYISQPTVTARIQSLERELDCRVSTGWASRLTLRIKADSSSLMRSKSLQVYQRANIRSSPRDIFRMS